MWFGTFGGGLSKFNGKEFYNYTIHDGLSSNIIFSIIEDKNKRIWLATMNGINCLKNDSIYAFTEKQGLTHPVVRGGIIEDKDGNLLAGTNKGVTKILLDESGKVKLVPYKNNFDFADKRISCLFYDFKGSLWIGTEENGLYIIKGDSCVNLTVANGLSSNAIGALYQKKGNEMIIGTMGGGVCIMDIYTNTFSILNQSNGLLNNSIYSIEEDENGFLWFSTEKGVHKLTNGKFIAFTQKNGLSNNVIVSSGKDNEGNLWFGTNGGGVSQYRGEKFILFPSPSIVQTICKDKNNDIWYGTYGNGIFRFKDSQQHELFTPKNFTEKNGLPGDRVWSLLIDRLGNMWVGCDGGLATLSDGKITKKPSPPVAGECWVHHLFEDNIGRIWITLSSGEPPYVYDRGKYLSMKEMGVSHEFPEATKITQEKEGDIWVATLRGLYKFSLGNATLFNTENGLFSSRISSIDFDESRNIWLGMQGGGLIKFKEGKQSHLFSIKDGISGDNVSMVFFDTKKNLWLGTNKGLDKIEFDFEGNINKIKNFSEKDGFKGGSCESNAAFEDENGCLWFGTSNGLVKYNPAEDKKNLSPPIMKITDIRLFLEKVNWSKTFQLTANENYPNNLSLPYNKNHLTFDFIGISFSAPEDVRYSYKMDGLSEKWSPLIIENFVTFSSLPSGEYTFHVKAMNNDGVWSDVQSYSFTITPPFWKTWWFIGGGCVLVIAVFVFYLRIRERNLRKSKLVLVQKVKEKTELITRQKENIVQINKNITDSINYAQRIQKSIMQPVSYITSMFSDSFIVYKPKDIVSGDFYWLESKKEKHSIYFLAAADCTGHGVPGAMVSVICNSALKRSINEYDLTKPSEILNKTREIVIGEFEKNEEEVKDGMDISFCTVTYDNANLQGKVNVNWAGANNPLWIIQEIRNDNTQLVIKKTNSHLTPDESNLLVLSGQKSENDKYCFFEIKADKQPIGKTDQLKPFTNHEFQLQEGDLIYLFTDGFCDQFGGEKGKKFKSSQFKKLLLELQCYTLTEQKSHINEAFEKWKGNLEQVDDVCVIGVKI